MLRLSGSGINKTITTTPCHRLKAAAASSSSGRFSLLLISTILTHRQGATFLNNSLKGPGPGQSITPSITSRHFHIHITSQNTQQQPSRRRDIAQRTTSSSSPPSSSHSRAMSSSSKDSNNGRALPNPRDIIRFGPFEVTNQVFLMTPHSFALVNLKPLLPGHVLVCPLRPARRLTDLTPAEVTDLFTSVQIVQRMLARHYFAPPPTAKQQNGDSFSCPREEEKEEEEEESQGGSFNIAVQDGPEAGQTVAHVHVHVIPRIRGHTAKDAATPSDELYDRMAGEDGNVGGAHWDYHRHYHHHHDREKNGEEEAKAGRRRREVEEAGLGRPEPGGKFPSIEDSQRLARSMDEMEREADIYRRVLRELELEAGDGV